MIFSSFFIFELFILVYFKNLRKIARKEIDFI